MHKLQLQYLTFEDYLMRNYALYRLESFYQIKCDLENTLFKTTPYYMNGKFQGFQNCTKNVVDIKTFFVRNVVPPQIGSKYPTRVEGELNYSVQGLPQDCRKEFESIKKHDVLFLVSF